MATEVTSADSWEIWWPVIDLSFDVQKVDIWFVTIQG